MEDGWKDKQRQRNQASSILIKNDVHRRITKHLKLKKIFGQLVGTCVMMFHMQYQITYFEFNEVFNRRQTCYSKQAPFGVFGKFEVVNHKTEE